MDLRWICENPLLLNPLLVSYEPGFDAASLLRIASRRVASHGISISITVISVGIGIGISIGIGIGISNSNCNSFNVIEYPYHCKL